LGRATRLVSFLMKSGKEYVAIMELHGNVSDYDLKRVIEEFIGPIYQLPPIRSSVKRALRIRTINSIKIIESVGKYVLMKVDCEAGTYIRKLCHDIGEVLGCGAHMKELRRIRAGPFTEKNSITLHSLLDAITLWKERNDESLLRRVILPIEETLLNIPKIYVRDSAVDALCHGANLASPGVLRISKNIKAGDFVCVMTLKGELIGIGKLLKSSEEILESDHGIVVDMERVIMEPGTYPKSWN
ncbi:MAG: RNA-guided pseudouridylation complex pseudouridine synthase subunit Cbf5, partial [Candidatus Methanomethyliaceae archaeon]|nr:RNA-guided pseudouridylation complex pseudouridine synthase subunit Cbf5 [Candidatus Methanomethyliaceae archaeon]